MKMMALLEGYLSLLNRQAGSLNQMYERARGGDYGSDQMVKDAARFWSLCVDGIMFPWTFFAGSMQEAPLFTFVVDSAAGTADPKRVLLSYRPTDITSILWDENGNTNSAHHAREFATHISIAHGPFFVDVGLKDLRDDVSTPLLPGLPVGKYVGVVFDDRPGDKAVIAQLHVLKLPAPSKADDDYAKGDRQPQRAKSRKKPKKKASRRAG